MEWEGQQLEEEEEEYEEQEQQQQVYEEEEEDDILDMGEDTAANEQQGLLMRFCPHDSSMLYPQVRNV